MTIGSSGGFGEQIKAKFQQILNRNPEPAGNAETDSSQNTPLLGKLTTQNQNKSESITHEIRTVVPTKIGAALIAKAVWIFAKDLGSYTVEKAGAFLVGSRKGFAATKTLPGKGASAAAHATKAVWKFTMTTDKYFDISKLSKEKKKNLFDVIHSTLERFDGEIKLYPNGNKLTLMYQGKALGYEDLIKLTREKETEYSKNALKHEQNALEEIKSKRYEAGDKTEFNKSSDAAKKAIELAELAKSTLDALLEAGDGEKSTFKEKVKGATSGPLGQHVAKGKLAGKVVLSPLAVPLVVIAFGHWLLTSKTSFNLPPSNSKIDDESNSVKYENLCKQLKAAFPKSNIEVKVYHGTVQVTIDGEATSLAKLQKMAKKQEFRAETQSQAQINALSWISHLDPKVLKGTESLKLRTYHAAMPAIKQLGMFFSKPRIVVDLNKDMSRRNIYGDTGIGGWVEDKLAQNQDLALRNDATAQSIVNLSEDLFGTQLKATRVKSSSVELELEGHGKLELQDLRARTNEKVMDLRNHLAFGENLTEADKTNLKKRIEAGEKLQKIIGAQTPAQAAEIRGDQSWIGRAGIGIKTAFYLPTIAGMGALKALRATWREHKYDAEINRRCAIVNAIMHSTVTGKSVADQKKEQKEMSPKIRNAMKSGFELQAKIAKQKGMKHEIGKFEGEYNLFINDPNKSKDEKDAFKEALKFENRALRNAMFHAHPQTINFLIKEGLFRNVRPGDLLFNSDTPALLFTLEHRTFDADDKLSSKIKEEIRTALFRNSPDIASREAIIQNLHNNGNADVAEKLVTELLNKSDATHDELISARTLAMTLGTPSLLKKAFDINPTDSQAIIQKKVTPYVIFPDIAGRTLLDFAPVGENMKVRFAIREALIEKYNSPVNPPIDMKTYKQSRREAIEAGLSHVTPTFSTQKERDTAIETLVKEFPELAYLQNMEVSFKPTIFGGLASESKRGRDIIRRHLERELSNLNEDPFTARDLSGNRPLRNITRDMGVEGNELLTQEKVNLTLATRLNSQLGLLQNDKLKTLEKIAEKTLANKPEELTLFKERLASLRTNNKDFEGQVNTLDYRSLIELLPTEETVDGINELLSDNEKINLKELKKACVVDDFTMAGAYYHVLESPRIGFITSCVVVGKFTGCCMAVIGLGLVSEKSSFFITQFIFQGSICGNIAASAYIGGTQNRAFWGKMIAKMPPNGYNRDLRNLTALRPADESIPNLTPKRTPGFIVRDLKAMSFENAANKLDQVSASMDPRFEVAKALISKYADKALLETKKFVAIDEKSTEIVHHLSNNDAESAIAFIKGLKAGEEKNVNWDNVIGNFQKMVHYSNKEERMELMNLLFDKLQTQEQMDDLIEIQNNMGYKPTFTEQFLNKKIAELAHTTLIPELGTPKRKKMDMQYAALMLAAAKIGNLDSYQNLKAIAPLFASCDLIKLGGQRNSLLHASLLSKLSGTNRQSVALSKEVFKDMQTYAAKHYPGLNVLTMRRGGSAWYTRWHAAVTVANKMTLEKAELFDEALGKDTALSGSLTSSVMRRLMKHTLSLMSEFIMVLPCKLMLNVAAGSKAEVMADVFAEHVATVLPVIPKVIVKAFAVFLIETGVLVSGFAAGIVLGKGITGSLQHARENLEQFSDLSAYGGTPTERMEKMQMYARLEEKAAAQMSIELLQESIQNEIRAKHKANPDDENIETLEKIHDKLEVLKNSNKEGKNMLVGIKYVILSEQMNTEGEPMAALPCWTNIHEDLMNNLEDPIKFGKAMQAARKNVYLKAAEAGDDVSNSPIDLTNPHAVIAQSLVDLQNCLREAYDIKSNQDISLLADIQTSGGGVLTHLLFLPGYLEKSRLHEIMDMRSSQIENGGELRKILVEAKTTLKERVNWGKEIGMITENKEAEFQACIKDLERVERNIQNALKADAKAKMPKT